MGRRYWFEVLVRVGETAMRRPWFPSLPELLEGLGDIFWVLVFYSGSAEDEEEEKEAKDACYASYDNLEILSIAIRAGNLGRHTPTNDGAEPCCGLAAGLDVAEGVDVDVGVGVGVIELLAPPLSSSPGRPGGPSSCRRCNNSPDKCIVKGAQGSINNREARNITCS